MRACQQHPAGVLGFAETVRDLLERQILELAEQDDLAMRVGERVERRLELAGLLVENDLRQHGSHARRQSSGWSSIGVSRPASRRWRLW